MRSIIYRFIRCFWAKFTVVHVLLWPLSWLFWMLISVRKYVYSSQQVKHSIPVILVGNLSVGGNGKTTYVIEQVRDLLRRGYQVGVITKGYARRYPSSTILVDHAMPAHIIGDEAALIWTKTQALICVSPQRSKACAILAQAGCDVVVCDDGLQDYLFYRDIEVSLCAESSLGNRMLLPIGPLREPLSRAKSCDYSVAQEAASLPSDSTMTYEIDAITNLATGEIHSSSTWPYPKDVASLCAIGAPERFTSLLTKAGFTVWPTVLPDHALISGNDLNQVTLPFIFITEKDAIKLTAISSSHSLWVVSIRAHFSNAHFEQVDQRLRQCISQRQAQHLHQPLCDG